MGNKIFDIFICLLLVSTFVSPLILTVNANKILIVENIANIEIFEDVEETEDKILIVDENIGDRQVKYWEHMIDDILVKNDFILLHMDNENIEPLKYEKEWCNIEVSQLDFRNRDFEPEDYFWKRAVVFPDDKDCTYFYTFDDIQKYPLVCWEVRHNDGDTILYNVDGEKIGHGIPAPSKGFSLSGYNDANWPDPWIEFRENADFWFAKWCTSTVSLSLPTPSTISSHIGDSTVEYFYELAHGDEYSFQAEITGSHFYATTLQQDMVSRQPMKFAFIGSCHGMTGSGPGTFSYEFRKGQMTDAVTVGFDNMETCPGWEYGYYWQDSMFENMTKGLTIKESFDLATAHYPTIEPAVVFLGDTLLKANHPPEKPAKPSGSLNGKAGTVYTYTSRTTDPEQNQVYYLFDWGDGSNSGWTELCNSGDEGSATYSWDEEGSYEIRVKAKDINDVESEWSDPLHISMPKNKAENLFLVFIKRFIVRYPLLEHMFDLQ